MIILFLFIALWTIAGLWFSGLWLLVLDLSVSFEFFISHVSNLNVFSFNFTECGAAVCRQDTGSKPSETGSGTS